MSITTSDIRTVLDTLPYGSDAVAEFLGTKNIKAECGNPNKCALAEYVAQNLTLEEGQGVVVTSGAVYVGSAWRKCSCSEECSVGYYDVNVSQIFFRDIARGDLADFIYRFDRHEFPYLEVEPAEVNA